MMLVEHDVEAELVGELILVVIAMKQVGGDARIAFAVREDHAQRAGMLVPGRIIGLFAKLIDSHAARSARYRVGQIVRSAARRRHSAGMILPAPLVLAARRAKPTIPGPGMTIGFICRPRNSSPSRQRSAAAPRAENARRVRSAQSVRPGSWRNRRGRKPRSACGHARPTGIMSGCECGAAGG